MEVKNIYRTKCHRMDLTHHETLGTALSVTIKSAIPDTETLTGGKEW